MRTVVKNYEDVDSWKTVMFLYNAAMKGSKKTKT